MRFGNNRVRLRIRRTLSVFAKPLFRSRPECADRFLSLCLFKKKAEEIFILLICISRRILYIRNLIIRKLYVSLDLLSCELMI